MRKKDNRKEKRVCRLGWFPGDQAGMSPRDTTRVLRFKSQAPMSRLLQDTLFIKKYVTTQWFSHHGGTRESERVDTRGDSVAY